MGLCRCPRRKVTTQFCYEHRVNVCEFCMVEDHPNCVVQGYLQWLKDSDYEPVCTLCRKELIHDECVRLLCYHVFHWQCLNGKMDLLPQTTAPAGYCCPTCNHEVIPRDNVVSPVAEMLRKKLSKTRWAKSQLTIDNKGDDASINAPWTPDDSMVNQSTQYLDNAIDSSINNMSSRGGHSRYSQGYDSQTTPLFQSSPATSDVGLHKRYEDSDKYKKRSPFGFLQRWIQTKLMLRNRRRDPTKRQAAFIIGFLFVLFVIVYALSHLGGNMTSNDSSLEPENNPEIRNNM